jgi:hypothetical protein
MGCCKSTQYGCCIAIDHDESIVLNKPTGKEIRHGPGWFCFPSWWDAQVFKTIALQNNQYIIVKHIIDLDNKDRSQNPNDIPLTKRTTLNEKDQLLNDPDMQLIEIVRGPQIYHLKNPYDRISEIKSMINLTPTQYIIVMDKLTGEKKVEAGPQLFCPKPYDEVGEIKNMYNLSSTEYIIVTDESTGEKSTVTGKNVNQILFLEMLHMNLSY